MNEIRHDAINDADIILKYLKLNELELLELMELRLKKLTPKEKHSDIESKLYDMKIDMMIKKIEVEKNE